MINQRWDIFCKIVDNFGDIGVCWRLAQQLQVEHGLQIRLWIDDLAAAQSIIASLDVSKNSQICDEITILKISENAAFVQAADVVIEAFACGLPPAYLAAMIRQQSKWVNLEYLSAENWVVDFHAKPSPQSFLNSANELTRHFYFPGFTEKTGGLIRERNIAAQLQNAINPRPQAGEGARQRGRGAEYVDLGVAPLSNLSPARGREALKISLFCYPNAPIHDLLTALQANIHAVCIYVPNCSILPIIAQYFGINTIKIGDELTKNNLTVHILPFLSQPDYDKLLSSCDLNFVRGEDSWVRAIWAGKPFIWQPYVQEENAHITKLNAFLNLFYAHYQLKQLVCKAHECWSTGLPWNDLVQGHIPNDVVSDYLNNLNTINAYTWHQTQQLAEQPDLATKLVNFCNAI